MLSTQLECSHSYLDAVRETSQINHNSYLLFEVYYSLFLRSESPPPSKSREPCGLYIFTRLTLFISPNKKSLVVIKSDTHLFSNGLLSSILVSKSVLRLISTNSSCY